MNKKTDNTDVIVQNSLINSSVEKMIQVIRDKQVLLDRDLATLYGVETKALNQAVKRNKSRFPERFMFQMSKNEVENLKSQSVISSFSASTGTEILKSAPVESISLKRLGRNCWKA